MCSRMCSYSHASVFPGPPTNALDMSCSHGLEFRRACIGAESKQHLCKSIIMENTKLAEPHPGVSKYYCVIVQVALRSLLLFESQLRQLPCMACSSCAAADSFHLCMPSQLQSLLVELMGQCGIMYIFGSAVNCP